MRLKIIIEIISHNLLTNNMKALILAGGRGTRLKPLTHTKNKHVIPIGNEPMIFRVISDIIEAGIKDIIININAGDKELPYIINSAGFNVEFKYIEQPEPNGMMYPIILAQDLIGDDKFLLHGGDNVLSGGLKKYVNEFEHNGSDAHLLVTKVDNPERFGVALTQGNRLIKTVEKPKKWISDLAMTAIYMYNSSVFEAMKHVEPIDPKGGSKPEYYPPPVHQWLVDNGYIVTVTEVTGWWKDTGKPDDLLLANRLVLERKENYIKEGKVVNSNIEGSCEIKTGAHVENSKIRGPVSIGRNVIIKNSYIGPYTSIGDNSIIENAQIENSIVMGNAKIHDLNIRLDSCLIGWNSEVTKKLELPKSSSLFIGDDSLILM